MATTATQQRTAQRPTRSNISPRLACLNLPSDRAGSVSERSSRRETAATADAYRVVSARLGGDADEVLHSTAATPEREAILEKCCELLSRASTAMLIACLPVLAKHIPDDSAEDQNARVRMRIAKPRGDSA